MAGFAVTPAYLLATYLSGLVTRLPQLAEPAFIPFLADAIAEASAIVQHDLSTRFSVTQFVPQVDTGVAAPLDQTGGPAEYEPYYQWPGVLPGDGFPVLRARIRPIQQIVSLTLTVPGTIISQFTFDNSWLRTDRLSSTIMISPTGSNAIYALAYAMGGLGWRTMQSAALTYIAGMEPTHSDWPRVNRVVAMRSVLALMPMLSAWLNPTALSSQSADGVSQSRKSGYVFADWTEKLEKDAETLTNDLIGDWDGPNLLVL
jgi:hypothetical protein